MESVIQQIEAKYKKKAVTDVRSGDTLRVHQKVREAGKERIQIFEGIVIRVSRKKSLTASFTVRRIASGVGVEKIYPLHSPSILKVEIVKRSKVRRNYLTYMRGLRGKSARLAAIDFDREAVNVVEDEKAEAEEAKIREEQAEAHETSKAESKSETENTSAAKQTQNAATKDSEDPKLKEKPKLKRSADNQAEEPNKQKD